MRTQVVEGSWFDLDVAIRYDAVDGSDTLYKTEDGGYALAKVREDDGDLDWEILSETKAYQWMLDNGCIDSLPKEERETRKL